MIEAWLSHATADPEIANRGRVLNMLALVIAIKAPLMDALVSQLRAMAGQLA
jgi:hypothetical protein